MTLRLFFYFIFIHISIFEVRASFGNDVSEVCDPPVKNSVTLVYTQEEFIYDGNNNSQLLLLSDELLLSVLEYLKPLDLWNISYVSWDLRNIVFDPILLQSYYFDEELPKGVLVEENAQKILRSLCISEVVEGGNLAKNIKSRRVYLDFLLNNVPVSSMLTFSKWAQAFFPSGGIHSNIGLAYGLFKNTDPEIRDDELV